MLPLARSFASTVSLFFPKLQVKDRACEQQILKSHKSAALPVSVRKLIPLADILSLLTPPRRTTR